MKRFYSALVLSMVVLVACGQANTPKLNTAQQPIAADPLAGFTLKSGEMKMVTQEQYDAIKSLMKSGKSLSDIFAPNQGLSAQSTQNCANASNTGNDGKISSVLAFGGGSSYNIAIKMNIPSYWNDYATDTYFNNVYYRNYFNSTFQIGIPRSTSFSLQAQVRGVRAGQRIVSVGFLDCITGQ